MQKKATPPSEVPRDAPAIDDETIAVHAQLRFLALLVKHVAASFQGSMAEESREDLAEMPSNNRSNL